MKNLPDDWFELVLLVAIGAAVVAIIGIFVGWGVS